MKSFTIVNIQGKILSTGVCQAETFNDQVSGTDRIFEGLYPDDKYYWDNEFIEFPPKPEGIGYEFNYETKQWELDKQIIIDRNRTRRNSLLQASDWTQNNDSPLTTEKKQEWAVYRQKLRDMTEQDFIDGNFPKPI